MENASRPAASLRTSEKSMRSGRLIAMVSSQTTGRESRVAAITRPSFPFR
jgi:hypothetical protein